MTVQFRARRSTVAIVVVACVMISACSGDTVTGTYTECVDQPGCQPAASTVPVEVMQSLDDAGSRAVGVLPSTQRSGLDATLARLGAALVRRDIAGGRVAFAATIDAITRAERSNPEAIADLGAMRLGLVPAARSLGLPVSDVSLHAP